MPPASLNANLDTLSRISQLFTECGTELSNLVARVQTSTAPQRTVIGLNDLVAVSNAWNQAGQALAQAPGLIQNATDPGPALLQVEAELNTIRDTLRNSAP